jgi:cytochrome d ubiquinol oxidase subunit I
VVFGWLRTADAVSPVGATQVSISLLAFLLIYALVFSVGVLYILRLVALGPEAAPAKPPPGVRPPGSPLGHAPLEEGPDDH